MPSLNFNAIWAPAVESGQKRTTLRLPGRARPGQTLYLFTGQRTRACRRLGQPLCLAITPVRALALDHPLRLGSQWLTLDQSEQLASYDTAGHWGLELLLEFLNKAYGLPVDLEMIIW